MPREYKNVYALFKTCTVCHEEKPVRGFYFDKRRSYFMSQCKPCMLSRTKTDRVKARDRWQRYGFKHDLKVRYGLAPEDYERMLAEQNGLCAICDQPPQRRRLHVDHSHNGDGVRALLCSNCNTALGKFEENPDLLLRAREYLIQWQSMSLKLRQANAQK